MIKGVLKQIGQCFFENSSYSRGMAVGLLSSGFISWTYYGLDSITLSILFVGIGMLIAGYYLLYKEQVVK